MEAAPSAKVALAALVEVLVEPLLPSRLKVPSPEERRSVAKQLHAVVLLYNYYHRQQYPEVEFLDYKSFCRLLVEIRPVLSPHMNLANLSAEVLADDWGKMPSPTEKAIIDACNIASSLEARGDVLNVEDWPLAKVSVLLVDSKKENCLLKFDSPTCGSCNTPEVIIDERQAKQSRFEHFAFAAIRKEKGIHMSKLAVLEKHVVYCLNKEKSAAYFFIMRCTDSSVEFEHPIKDAIESMEVPLLRWISDSWTLTQAVEYCDVLPYATIISSWYSRRDLSDGTECLNNFVKDDEECGEKGISNDLEKSNVGLGSIDGNSSLLPTKTGGNEALTQTRKKRTYSKRNATRYLTLEDLEKGNGNFREIISANNTKLGKRFVEPLDITQTAEENLEIGANHKETSGGDTVEINAQETSKSDKPWDTNHKEISCADTVEINAQETSGDDTVEINAQETGKSDNPWDCNDSETRARKKQKMDCLSMINLLMDDSNEGVLADVFTNLKEKIPLVSGALTTDAATQGEETSLASMIAKREKVLTKTALAVLYSKREKLVQQRHRLDGEIAQYNQNIHKILGGKEDSLAVKLDAIINGCKDTVTRYKDHLNGKRDA